MALQGGLFFLYTKFYYQRNITKYNKNHSRDRLELLRCEMEQKKEEHKKKNTAIIHSADMNQEMI